MESIWDESDIGNDGSNQRKLMNSFGIRTFPAYFVNFGCQKVSTVGDVYDGLARHA